MALKFVKQNKSKRHLNFGDLQQGDIFSNNGYWYIRTHELYDDCGDNIGNAIDLENGNIITFDLEDTVSRLPYATINYEPIDLEEWI